MINVAIIGSTGSIGTQTLDVIARHKDRFKLSMISANSNVDLLLKQYRDFAPSFVGIYGQEGYERAAKVIDKSKLLCGNDALTYAASLADVDIIVVAISGMIGLVTVEAAIRGGKRIALANKESLVAGGELVNDLLKKSTATLIPIDSEHSAIMQCIKAGNAENVKKLILTASGGPFFGKTLAQLSGVTVADALKHPTWSMGKKISIDSATMMNKALEIIEAYYLFGTKKIEYIIHPESIIHSMVEFFDTSVIAQLSYPSMEIPIQYALSIPDRLHTAVPSLNFAEIGKFSFKKPDEINFPAPKLARYALEKGGDSPCRFNAANEAAVELFMNGKIDFTDIYDITEKTVLKSKTSTVTTIQQLFDCYNETTKEVNAL